MVRNEDNKCAWLEPTDRPNLILHHPPDQLIRFWNWSHHHLLARSRLPASGYNPVHNCGVFSPTPPTTPNYTQSCSTIFDMKNTIRSKSSCNSRKTGSQSQKKFGTAFISSHFCGGQPGAYKFYLKTFPHFFPSKIFISKLWCSGLCLLETNYVNNVKIYPDSYRTGLLTYMYLLIC